METLGLSPSTPKPTSRIRELFWPAIEDEVAAVTAARNAMYVCLFIAALEVLASFITSQSGWVLVDALLFAMAGIGVRRLSRAAAIVAFTIYALEWLGTGDWSILRPILLAILLGGIRAAAFAHRKTTEDREAIANPPMDTTGMSRVSVLLEELPRRAWPVIHGPFLVALGLLVAVNLLAVNSLIFGRLFSIPTGSMEPTVVIGDKVFVLHQIFSGSPKRGDVIAVRFPVDHKQTFLKRIIGMPGDRIKIVNKALEINGTKVAEPYVLHASDDVDSYRDNFPSEPHVPLEAGAIAMLHGDVKNGELVVPPGAYFVMGDNRDYSLDSRYWGYVTEADMEGRPLFLIGKGKQEFLRYPLAEK
jgi:signal peptidase I